MEIGLVVLLSPFFRRAYWGSKREQLVRTTQSQVSCPGVLTSVCSDSSGSHSGVGRVCAPRMSKDEASLAWPGTECCFPRCRPCSTGLKAGSLCLMWHLDATLWLYWAVQEASWCGGYVSPADRELSIHRYWVRHPAQTWKEGRPGCAKSFCRRPKDPQRKITCLWAGQLAQMVMNLPAM